MKRQKQYRGFTLVELLVVVALIGLLSVAVVVALNPAGKISSAKTNTAKSNAKNIANAIERCITEYIVANPTATEDVAIGACDTAGELKITPLTADQALNANAGSTSLCFSELTGTAGQYIKFTHATGGVTTYVENAAAACSGGV